MTFDLLHVAAQRALLVWFPTETLVNTYILYGVVCTSIDVFIDETSSTLPPTATATAADGSSSAVPGCSGTAVNPSLLHSNAIGNRVWCDSVGV